MHPCHTTCKTFIDFNGISTHPESLTEHCATQGVGSDEFSFPVSNLLAGPIFLYVRFGKNVSSIFSGPQKCSDTCWTKSENHQG